MGLLSKLFPSHNERELKKLRKTADKIEALADKYKGMTNDELAACTPAFKARLANGETLDDILPEAFAAVREAADRVLHMRHFYVQLIGGIVLHQGRIAEMRTGEGKTLVATLAVYLNALAGKGVHVVTVNEYLAERDAGWMGNIYEFMGLTVGVNKARMRPEEKRAAYACDITYTTNNEVGFDYLRDNMAVRKQDRVMRGLDFAIVDEVDSILIDEARTPLIISGRGGKPDEMYELAQEFFDKVLVKESYRCPECGCNVDMEASVAGDKGENARIICPECGAECENAGDYEVVVKSKSVYLNDRGANKAYKFFKSRGKLNAEEFGDGRDITTYENQKLKHYIDNALTANVIMKKDENYIVVDGEIIIVDEFTGRQMIGRRFSNGLHQAIEAKEGVKIRSEDKTFATITFQNLFRLYRKLSGMTGTAKTEENEFEGTYNLDVVVIPTNKPVIRKDEEDKLYANENAKFRAIIEDIKECHAKGQPVLVGTTSVDKSEKLSAMLKRLKMNHNVLNAKYYEREAEIVAQAGQPGRITISTNMAGRGTDIMLGGNPEQLAKATLMKKGFPEALMEEASSLAPTDNEEILNLRQEYARLYDAYKKETDEDKKKVIAAGGLRIIGTERHESRRIDNQLRGRAGRQGDPGSSVFYLAMDDDILRRFGGEAMQAIVEKFRIDEDTPISAKIISRQIEAAQARVEDRNFSARKNLLAYDDVLARQREIIYRQRNEVLDGIASGKDGEKGDLSVHEQILKMAREVVDEVCADFANYRVDQDEWDYDTFNRELESAILKTGTNLITPEFAVECGSYERLADKVYEVAVKQYEEKIAAYKKDAAEKGVSEDKADYTAVERIFMLKTVDEEWIEHIDAMDDLKQSVGLVSYAHQDPVLVYKKEGFDMFEEMVNNIHRKLVQRVFKAEVGVRVQPSSAPQNLKAKSAGAEQEKQNNTVKRDGKKVGRNDPCPCGSGKKYKNCCGR